MIQCRVKEIMQMMVMLGEGDVACGSGTVEMFDDERTGIINFTDLPEDHEIGGKATQEEEEMEPDISIMVKSTESLDVLLYHVLRVRHYLITGQMEQENEEITGYINSLPKRGD